MYQIIEKRTPALIVLFALIVLPTLIGQIAGFILVRNSIADRSNQKIAERESRK